jgi:hypothetical protein
MLDLLKLKVRKSGLVIRAALISSLAFLAGCDKRRMEGVATDSKEDKGSEARQAGNIVESTLTRRSPRLIRLWPITVLRVGCPGARFMQRSGPTSLASVSGRQLRLQLDGQP